MKLNSLNKQKNYRSSNKIVGRGPGSGKGMHTVGRGMNGQRSRSGGNKSPRVDFAGGQNPISRQLPKLRGFKKLSTTPISATIKLSDLNKFNDGDKVTVETLATKGLINVSSGKNFFVKILSNGEVNSKNLSFEGVSFSKAAKDKLEKTGAIFE